MCHSWQAPHVEANQAFHVKGKPRRHSDVRGRCYVFKSAQVGKWYWGAVRRGKSAQVGGGDNAGDNNEMPGRGARRPRLSQESVQKDTGGVELATAAH